MADVKRKPRGGPGERLHAPEYQRAAGSRVLTRPGYGGIAYSDGNTAESELLDFLKRAQDVTTASDEVNLGIDGWMREAHLSQARSNLLRPLDFSGRRHVLELGAGCGAITRYLGERGLEVDAVEGSVLRAECAAERCRDLANVRVFADDIVSFRAERKYDVVTIIGVLEYARVFIEGEDPVRALLDIARGHLAPGGVLVLAIENQLGLKYFNGCGEDHLGTAYSGITDLYAARTAVTFGKAELEGRLRRAGFARVDWAYPFPDYKIPTAVISARGLADPDFRAGDMLVGEFARDYGGSHLRAFDESAVWGVLERNGVLGDFANSFLVVASLERDSSLDDGAWLAYRFSPQRLKPFSTRTRFARETGAGIVVTKLALEAEQASTPEGSEGGFHVRQDLGAQPYVTGRILARDFFDAVARGYAPRELAQFLKPWIDFLAARCTGAAGAEVSALRIPGRYLDCIPTNLVVDEKGVLQPIDLEFVVPGEIPLPWVVLRGTIHLATKCFGHRELARKSFREFLDEMLPALGFGDVADWKPYFDLEDALIRTVLRPWKGRPDSDILRSRVEIPICAIQSLPESYRQLLETTKAGMQSLEASHALVGELARWLAMLPDPATEAPAGESRALPAEVLELAARIGIGLERLTGTNFEDRLRELAAQRGRWAWLARDNQRLAWELNDAQARLEELGVSVSPLTPQPGGAVAADGLQGEVATLRIERNALRYEAEEARAQLDSARADIAAKDAALAEAAHREREAAGRIELLQSGLASREAALTDSGRRERELERALGIEQGRFEGIKAELAGLREERQALKEEAVAMRVRLDNALVRLRRRGAENGRVHRRLRESTAREADSAREAAELRRAATWRFTKPLRAFYRRFPGPWNLLSGGGRVPVTDEPTPEMSEDLIRRAKAVAASDLFDAAWYRREHPEVSAAGHDPLHHYLERGWREGLDPNPLFHESWYRLHNADTLRNDESGLEHYLREGMAENRWPNPLFDPEWYLRMYPDVARHDPGVLHHFLVSGAREGRDPHPLFDTDWFLHEYPDAASIASVVNPLAYYLDLGLATAHSPCEEFDAEWYLSEYPDVDAAGVNPLVHYLEYGVADGRNPSTGFDTKWYLESYPDVVAAGMNPLVHYRISGKAEGRAPLPRRRMTESEVPPPHAVRLPAADGVQEWQDYAPLKDRIAADAAIIQGQVSVEPAKLIEVAGDAVDAAIARLSFPAHPEPRVSIIVPVYNQLALTLECLLSVAAAGAESTFEVIVADDGSADDIAARLAGVPGLRVHRNATNLGFLRNCNSALPLARGEYVVLLNNDVQVTPGWLDALVATFSTSEHVGATGPKLLYPSGHLQEAGVALRSDGTAEMVGLNDDPAKERYNYERPVDYVSGACLMVPTALLRELGGLSEDFLPCYCEDSDLCMRIRAKGLRIVYQPQAAVYHHLSKTTAEVSTEAKLETVAGSLNVFVQKWQAELDRLAAVRVLAFYLPQFHPIPENDHWWGPGFTEWSNVARAQPNFVGHYQPRVPADLGFYDLRLPGAMQAQAELARRYGVHGFCCYYYWFAGKRLLELPVERMLATGQPDIPYCLCWANENWTRRWDGADREVLVAQKYSPEDDEAVILDLIRHFRGGNYIRVDGKPLLLVYRVSMFPDFRATAERWRRICRREGIGDIYLAMVESFDLVHAGARPDTYNCDASVEFPPLGMAQPRPPSGRVTNLDFVGHTADYRDIAARFCARPMPAYTRLRGVMPGWDNTARMQDKSFCFENATPGAFQAWMETAIAQTRAQHHGDERIVFVNAWNEWAEGAYLEPDKRYGHAFLEAVRNAQDADGLLRLTRYALQP